MSEQRYPADLAVTAQDFADCGWKDVLAGTSREGYSTMWQAFSAAARQAMEEGRQTHGKVLWLLADACSMMLSPKSRNEPFKPFAVFHDRRSVTPEDLTETDTDFLAAIVDTSDDVWLKARLADLAWLKRKPRDVKFALAAIDSYRAIPLDTETWVHGGRMCWERAICLALMLKAGAGNRLSEMEVSVFSAFVAATRADGFLGLWLADLLEENGLGSAQKRVIALRLESLAREFDGVGDLHQSREYFGSSARWFKRAGDEAKEAAMIVEIAEGCVKEAIARTSSDSPSHMVAASLYENAIQTYRTIPRSERGANRVDERIAELRTHLNDSGEQSLGEMSLISTPSTDITMLVENARKAVTGKSATDALLAFANLHRGTKVDEMRQSALDRMRRFSFSSLFSSTVLSRDGRVIAKRPAMGFGSETSSDEELAIRAEMVRDYGILVSIVVQSGIWPALEVLTLEHRLLEADFVALARQSPIVPKERAGLFGKALFAGYDGDFVTALHLLIPQIEHMVRVHLKQAGAKTSNLDKDGIENENGLSTLMDLPEAETVFGKDLAFELKTLFCDAFGPNLRNELAHGLLEQDACYSAYAIYAWWLGLRLVFSTWWNAVRSPDVSAGDESKVDEEEHEA
ncbi:DUF4209 domain-containing protein [Pseudomonas fluorescens]|uniref:DUF4209 domain-containing protein n=1 Tax=Pseudomonas fluorescens TaxID=294 RepID=UPI003CFFEB50